MAKSPKLPSKTRHITIFNQPDCTLPKSFFEGRFIPNFHPESLDYEQWWNEQITRCEQGWSDGGFSVTPQYYYHLNFKKINMLDMKTLIPGLYHPYFAYEDQQLFNDFQEAWLHKEGFFLITGRGFGKSFSVATLVEHKFTFQEVSETIVTASTDKFANLLWEKIQLGLNTQPEEIRRSMKVDTTGTKQSGYQEKEPGTNRFKWFDETGFIRKVVYDSDPEKTRGTRPDLHVFEEVGSWTGAASLIDCYKKTEPSWWRGSIKGTFPIFIGTGGAMDTGGSVDAKLIFNNPEEFGLKAYIYEGEKIGKFIPAYDKFTGYYEKSGESDAPGAKEFLDKRREKKKKNPDLYRQETSEFPYNPTEAFQTNGSGIFPIDLLEKRYVEIERNPLLKNLVQRGNLDFKMDGGKIVGVEWKPAAEGDPWTFEIAEHPAWTKADWKGGENPHLYISGCDSFDSAAEDSISKGKSPGSIIIFKRFYDIATTGRFFVAKCTQRTEDATEFYMNTVKLNMYYNCKMLAEYTKIGIFQYYITKKFEHMLYKRPRLDKTVVKESVTTNTYGLSMPEPVKRHVIFNLKAFVMEPGTMEQFYFQSLIRDMLSFSFEGRDKNKHDETMAAALAVMGDADMYKIATKKEESLNVAWPVFRRNAGGGLVFD